MVKELIIYPDDRINIACTDIRKFDENLTTLIQDMKDTLEANSLKAISAIHISFPYNVIIIKTEEGYDEYINPRILKNEGTFDATETSLYYPKITLNVPRYENIRIVYEDKDAKTHHKEIKDREYSWLFQQMFDHLFGGTFLDRVSKQKKDTVIQSMSKNGYVDTGEEVCPTFSRKDYFVSFTDKLLVIMFLTLLTPLFNFSKETIGTFYTIDKFLFPAVIALMIGFFFYAQYEAAKYKQCTSCQVGNNIGVVVKRVVAGIAFAIGAYFILG